MPLPQPELAILRKAQAGDPRAFAELVTAYERPVFNYVLRMVGERTLAEDLTQDVFLRIYNGLPGFSLRCRFTTWLFQVAKNRVLDELRARDRRPRPDALDTVSELAAVDAPPERTEIIDGVRLGHRCIVRRRLAQPRDTGCLAATSPGRRRPGAWSSRCSR
jgi:RNA polymerase sigma factor (sigma-70 family)